MRVIAERLGEDNKSGSILILVSDSENPIDRIGFVYRLGEEYRYPDSKVENIIARGYWENPDHVSLSPEELERIKKLPLRESKMRPQERKHQ